MEEGIEQLEPIEEFGEDEPIEEEDIVPDKADVKWKEVNPSVWKPQAAEDSITGVLLSKEPKKDQLSARYMIETEPNKISLVWGCTILDDRLALVDVGTRIRITFKEKKELPKGKHLNIYKVEVAG